MTIVRKAVLGGLVLLSFSAKAQQSPQFNMGFVDRVFTNSGEAGNTVEDLFKATLGNRLEVTNFEGAPVTNVISLHGPVTLFGIMSGVGITLYNDMVGSLRAPGVSIMYAYRQPLADGWLGIGIDLGMLSSWYANSSGWRLPDGGSIDPAVPTREEAALSFDMGIGASYYSNTWFGGISCKHLTEPSVGVERITQLKRNVYMHAGYKYVMDESQWMIMPMFDLVTDFAQSSYRIHAAAWYGNKYLVGLGYRWGQAVTGMLGIDIFNGVKVVYAYDYLTSKLSRFSGGCHELTVSYSFSLIVPRGTQRYKSIRYL
jgi:type IX secretion system PorP/SprF family membrane protein